ncbi:MAG TPA: PAS domain-containing sensor histidine kinase [Longimicrobium sp.]|nr:PAS domain-containing sensor histidine kinase [Longimicrobium sp.]
MTAGAAAPGRSLDPLLDHAPCGYLSFADDGTITAANATLAAMLGHAPGELEGRRMDTVLTVGARLFYQTHFFPLVRMHGHAEEVFLVLRAADGGNVPVLANVARVERGGAWANDCVFMRVTERAKFEEQLLNARREADRARQAVEEHAEELRAANETLEQQAVELEMVQQQLEEQAVEMEVQSEHLKALNDELMERSDEAERQRAAAEEANRAKSSFLAVMSHELRTPLNAIAGYVQLLEMGIHGPVTPPQREALDRIARSQNHLLRLINDVLNLARIESGRVEFSIAPVGLPELMAQVTPMVEPQMAAKSLAFAVDVPPGTTVLADREKVEQILINLLGNAIKFTPPGGRVWVEAVREPGSVRVRVCDSGIGIPPEKQAAVFEPFVQVDAGRTGRSEGSGLGLAISRDLARGMGSELSLESEVGKGSAFTLTLPAAA